MPTTPSPAVIYAAKSTADVHGSIPAQLVDCRTRAEREGWRVVREFSDEAARRPNVDGHQGAPVPRLPMPASISTTGMSNPWPR
jgi:hypothetical protein